MSYDTLYSTVARKDYLGLMDQGEPRYDRVVKLLGFGNREVAQATGLSPSSIRFDVKVPQEVVERIKEWSVVLNLVAQFFEGDQEKTSLWFTMPNPMLGNVAPRDMLRVGRFRRLYQFILEAQTDNSPPEDHP
jgi:uncharacterized protein (DUF2384 family)